MKRREFMVGCFAAFGAAALSRAAWGAPRAEPRGWLVPGYDPGQAFIGERSALSDPALRRNLPGGYDGPTTLLTRVRADGEVLRALMPVASGHGIAVRPDGKMCFWAGMNDTVMLGFEPETLKLRHIAKPHDGNFVAGGHGAFVADSGILLATERRAPSPWLGSAERHHGVVTIRDAATFKVIDRVSSFGIAPHEISLTADGRYAAIANYGVINPGGDGRADLRGGSLTVIELASGKLIDEAPASRAGFEVRHVAAHALDRIAAIQVQQAPLEEVADRLELGESLWEADQTVRDRIYDYQPSPLLLRDAATGQSQTLMADDPLDSRQGQSIIYDPTHDEFIASFATSHRLQVIDAASGRLKRVIRTDRLGLRQPRGVALTAAAGTYAVSGSWSGLLLFERGSHRPLLDQSRLDLVFFNHSHMTAY